MHLVWGGVLCGTVRPMHAFDSSSMVHLAGDSADPYTQPVTLPLQEVKWSERIEYVEMKRFLVGCNLDNVMFLMCETGLTLRDPRQVSPSRFLKVSSGCEVICC
ncbi:unnamed protein product [Choristocarpus tenellus]